MTSTVSRRDFLASTGLLVVGFSLGAHRISSAALPAPLAPAANQVDSWLVIGADGSITVYAGKVELGTGVSTALRQIVAEELDAPFDRIVWVQGDSDRTVDQGSTVGSQTIKRGGAQLRLAAANARAILLGQAALNFSKPEEALLVANGVISVRNSPDQRVTFGELLGGKRFDRVVDANIKPKRPSDYRIVGKPVRRVELPAKMTGRHTYLHDVHVDGMVHA